jgi:septal ring factor EnvC (AmiA/AmiB activator)
MPFGFMLAADNLSWVSLNTAGLPIVQPVQSMKAKVIIPLVVIIAIGLGIALFASRSRISQQAINITNLSNQVSKAQETLVELKGVNETLTGDLKQRTAEFLALTNNYTQAIATLAKTEGDLKQTEQTLRTTKGELEARNAKIAELENQNVELDKKSATLSAAITNLSDQINATEAKLAASEGDKKFLQGELSRLMAEKAQLEKQLNDLQFLKAQVSHLKAELSIAKRLEWIRNGLFNPSETKGAQLLIQKETSKPREDKNYDLNVEINADGSVKVIPPPTNAPAKP